MAGKREESDKNVGKLVLTIDKHHLNFSSELDNPRENGKREESGKWVDKLVLMKIKHTT